jgi:hypothetical protein
MEHRRVGEGDYPFEVELKNLVDQVGRLPPEIEGVHLPGTSPQRSHWIIRTCIPKKPEDPNSKDIIYKFLDKSWMDGVIRAMQEAMARLCEIHKEELQHSSYQHFGRRDKYGLPVEAFPECRIGHQMENLEYLLQRHQEDLDKLRRENTLLRMDFTLLKTRERCLKAENQRLTKKIASSKASSSEAPSEDEAPKNEYLARIMGSDYPSILLELEDDE